MWRLRIPDLPKVRDAARASGRSRHRLIPFCFAVAAALLLSACGSDQAVAKAKSGYAYVGPASLNLRKDLGPRAPMVDSAQHGEKLEVLETRRRFARVRTPRGIEGWADSNLLLTQQQVDDIERLAQSAAKMASQGKASVYDALNVHTEPSRPSPSFTQIPEGGTVEVLAHRVTLQSAVKPAPKVQVKTKSPTRASAKSEKKEEKPKDEIPPPPMPPAPKPPQDWVARSVPRSTALDGSNSTAPPPKPSGDDWYLVRMSDGKAGWVLARNLYMLIPDEVAQYAERKRITSYVSLGIADDRDPKNPKHNWLWTTSATPLQPNVFDSFRVFVWSSKRNHYETAFIERNVKGYYPIETVDLPDKQEKGFSVIIEDKDGQLYKRVYGFSGYRIRMISKTPYQPPPELPMISDARSFEPPPEPETEDSGILDRIRGWWRK
jgi:uncharacterized protein YgiM (DUF1202 family)